MKKIFYCFASLYLLLHLFCTPPINHRVSIEPFQKMKTDIPEHWKDEPVIILQDTTIISFDSSSQNSILSLRYITWYYVNKRNPNLLEQFKINEFTNLEKTPIISAQAWYADGTDWKLSNYQISRYIPQESVENSSNEFVNRFLIPKYSDDLLIRLETKRYFTKPEFFKSHTIRQEYPILNRVVLYTTPTNSQIKYRINNAENIKLDTVHKDSLGKNYLIIKADSLEKISQQEFVRYPEKWYAGLYVSLPPKGNASFSWSKIGDYMLDQYKPSLLKAENVRTLASKIPGNTQDSFVSNAVLTLRQKIRYHADFKGLHSYIPREADRVLANGYGDCKEMSSLLKLILDYKKIPCGFALLSTTGYSQIDTACPTLSGFNHVIVYIKNSDSTFTFLDPTVDYGNPFWAYYTHIGQYAFILEPNKSKVVTIDAGKYYNNSVLTKSRIYKDSLNNWQIHGKIILKGYSAYTSYVHLNPLTIQEQYPLLKADLYRSFDIDITKGNLDYLTPESLAISFSANFGRNILQIENGGIQLNQPSIKDATPFLTTMKFLGPRNFTSFTQQDTWVIPAGYRDFEFNLPKSKLLKGDWKKTSDTTIVREFSQFQNGMYLTSDKNEISEIIKDRSNFNKATLWR